MFSSCSCIRQGRDSSVGIATRYGLDGPGIESRWGVDFSHPSRSALGSPSLLYNGYRVFPGEKAAWAWRWTPTPSSTEVKERVKLYLYSTWGPSWPVIGWILPLPLPSCVRLGNLLLLHTILLSFPWPSESSSFLGVRIFATNLVIFHASHRRIIVCFSSDINIEMFESHNSQMCRSACTLVICINNS